MDESFLSDASVIQASRKFVCIRLATYEDEAEAEFLKTVYLGRSGDLENTVFVLLSPDTKENLCRPGRSPNFAFRTPKALAEGMDKIAKKYQTKEVAEALHIHRMKNVRLGINVASCDGLPAIVCYGKTEKQQTAIENVVAKALKSDSLVGKFICSTTVDKKELKIVTGFKGKPGVLIVTPDPYGLKGVLEETVEPNVDSETLAKSLNAFVSKASKANKDHRQHVREGNRSQINWKTEIPVTDQGSLKAMERSKNGRGRRR